jgi:hypothetical protein
LRSSLPRLAAAACVAAGAASAYPLVTYATLDGNPGFAVIELNPHMSLAYDFEGAGLQQSWEGLAKNEATGPGKPGEAPLRREGPLFHIRREAAPWSALRAGKPLPVKASLVDAHLEDGLPKVTYKIRIGKDTARIEEYPEYDDHYGARALFRYFVYTGIPKGVTLRLDLRGRPPREGEKPKFTEVGPESVTMENSGKTRVKLSWPPLEWGAGW